MSTGEIPAGHPWPDIDQKAAHYEKGRTTIGTECVRCTADGPHHYKKNNAKHIYRVQCRLCEYRWKTQRVQEW